MPKPITRAEREARSKFKARLRELLETADLGNAAVDIAAKATERLRDLTSDITREIQPYQINHWMASGTRGAPRVPPDQTTARALLDALGVLGVWRGRELEEDREKSELLELLARHEDSTSRPHAVDTPVDFVEHLRRGYQLIICSYLPGPDQGSHILSTSAAELCFDRVLHIGKGVQPEEARHWVVLSSGDGAGFPFVRQKGQTPPAVFMHYLISLQAFIIARVNNIQPVEKWRDRLHFAEITPRRGNYSFCARTHKSFFGVQEFTGPRWFSNLKDGGTPEASVHGAVFYENFIPYNQATRKSGVRLGSDTEPTKARDFLEWVKHATYVEDPHNPEDGVLLIYRVKNMDIQELLELLKKRRWDDLLEPLGPGEV